MCVPIYSHICTQHIYYINIACGCTYPKHNFVKTYFLKILFIYQERKGGRKRGRDTSMCGYLLSAPYRGAACKPGVCPDWELNQ